MRGRSNLGRWPELSGYPAKTREAILRRAVGGGLAAGATRRVALGMMACVTFALWFAFSMMVCGIAFSVWDAMERSSWGPAVGVVACLLLLACVVGGIYVPLAVVRGMQESWTREQLRACLASDLCAGCEYPKPRVADGRSVICPECGLIYPAVSTPDGSFRWEGGHA